MLARRVLSLGLAVALVAVVVLVAVPTARADYLMNFTSVVSSCESGAYTVRVSEVSDLRVAADGVLISAYNARVEVRDSDDTMLGENSFPANPGNTYSGTITYSHEAVGPTVTYYLYYSYNQIPQIVASQAQEILADVVVVDAECKAVPGCDVFVPIPSTAVVGRFTTSAAAYWEPGQLITNPPITIEAGKTYYVIGQDQSEQYYKIALGCDFVWVLKSTVGPNPDDVWQNMPLPTTIVD